MLTVDQEKSRARAEAVSGYLTANVDDGCELRCSSAERCRASMRGSERLVEGQLSHVGTFYDLSDRGWPMRIMVVSKQVGGALEHGGARGDEHVSMANRSLQVHAAKAGPSPHPRTNHMVGTELALKVLLGGSAQGEPFADISGFGGVHVFDCMALVNATLCSRVSADASGQGSAAMFAECRRHLVETIRLLEPTVVLAQGWTKASAAGREPSVASMVASAFGIGISAADPSLSSIEAPWGTVAVVTAYHPSRHWAAVSTPYWSKLQPVLKEARRQVLASP
jgi:hypothetical protein